MGKSYRVMKVKNRSRSAFPATMNQIEEPIMPPRLVLGVKFSNPRADIGEFAPLPPQAPLARREPQLPVHAQKLPNNSLTRQPQSNSLEQLSAAPRAAEISWRAVTLLLVLAAGATAAVYLFRQHLSAPLPPLGASEQAAALASTAFIGTIKPASEIKIAAPAGAVVQKLFVTIGAQVNEGDAILALDAREANAALKQAELDEQAAAQEIAQLNASLQALTRRRGSLPTEAAAAQGRLSIAQRRAEQIPVRQRQDSPERAQAVYDQAKARFHRVEGLHKDGLISTQEYDEALSALRIAEADLRSAQAAAAAMSELEQAQQQQSELQRELAGSEQEKQRAELNSQLERARLRHQQAAAAVENARRRVADTIVKSASKGVIVDLPAKQGDQIFAGAPLARIAQLDALTVEVAVSARLINALQTGRRAIVKLPNSSMPVAGKVITINPLPEANLSHTVAIEFENRSGAVLAGQPAEVHFLTD